MLRLKKIQMTKMANVEHEMSKVKRETFLLEGGCER